MRDSSGAELQVGTVVALEFFENQKFVINAILEGGMGSVFQLVPIRPAQPCAMKTFQPHIDRQAFERECEIWLSLSSHANIARALAYGSWQDQPVILVEWYGESLSDTDLGEWSTQDVISLVESIVTALDFSHQRSGLVHQDIKPSNILLDSSRQPRLSDFGLARCAGGDRQLVASLTDVNADTFRAVTVTSEGGTPIYMAPELFQGARASVRTDLYSLGVTVYEILTGEHPYFGKETAWRFLPRLRKRPLDLVLRQRGDEAAPIVKLITSCIALDPTNRPSDYMSLVRELRREGPILPHSRLTDQDVVHEAISLAVFYRKQGRYSDASQLLGEHLKARPGNPELLNALGVLRSVEGKTGEAIVAYKQATDLLIRSHGTWHGELYLDPIVNYANGIIAEGDYQVASELLGVAWSWLASDESRQPVLYNEFAWMWLYEGKFDQCVEYSLNVLKEKTPDSISLWWLLEAAWLAGQLDRSAQKIGTMFLQLRPTDLGTVLCACLVAAYCSPRLSHQLLDLVDRELIEEIRLVERENGLAFRPPCSKEAERLIVRSMDQRMTGGRHSGLIG